MRARRFASQTMGSVMHISGKIRQVPATISRLALLLILPFSTAACSTFAPDVPVVNSPQLQPNPAPAYTPPPKPEPEPTAPTSKSQYELMYGAVKDAGWTIPALDVSKIDERNFRRLVDYETHYPVGTIIVDPYKRYLYLVEPNNKAMRYSVGVGRAGLQFSGEAEVAYKARWPRWTPTQNMIKRNPEHYAKYANGLEGGINNPLGARALYLYRDGKDTLYRIHGTNEPWSVGKAASSGCIRLFNQDILDLHQRVCNGSRVVVLSKEQSDRTMS